MEIFFQDTVVAPPLLWLPSACGLSLPPLPVAPECVLVCLPRV